MSGDSRGGGLPGSGEESGGGWETIGKKSKKSTQLAGKGQWPQQNSSNAAPAPTATGSGFGAFRPGNNPVRPADHRSGGRVNPRPPPQNRSRSTEPELQAPRRVVTAPLAHGWQWAARSCPSGSENKEDGVLSGSEMDNAKGDDSSDNDNDDDLSDDMSDEFDSDASEKSFESRKKHRMFKSFFEVLETLSVEQLNEPNRQWHCPACKNGPGAIDWYKGLQPLMTHARTKGSIKVKLHRELAALLEEELSCRGTSVVPSGEQFGKWKGLRESTDRQIVWPPMVIIMNTFLEKDEDDKWKGMGNQELIEYFSEYAASKARHSYGPSGHRGMSVLIFDASAVGYMEAERLHRHFVVQRTDRDAWQNQRVPFLPGGTRQLYGFLAKKEDMDLFNRHCHGMLFNYFS
ncbi:hypothetical protein GUJ93_ZPchr0009g867 [Zizania palustris]|uniref:Uncharacterized protein n=1 Tax=Zizania palustris TaxID=103762 RepID=A0A8J5VNE7_ZIZPA|nr:hypothetical protein GUJ93_ZPchr0009g867 [Zizania palustris]